MSHSQKLRALREAVAAIESAATKLQAAGLMFHAIGLKESSAMLHVRAAMCGLGLARDCARIEMATPTPAVQL